MKIAVIQDAVDTPGGVETYLAAVIPALRARGHSLALLYLQRRGGTPLITGFDGPAVNAAVRPGEAIEALRAWGAEIAFANNMSDLDLEERVLDEWPVVKFMHGYFGTCLSALKMHAFPRRVPCDRELGAGCVALYVPRRCGPLRPMAMLRGYRFATREHGLLSRYARVLVGSEHMAREFARHGVTRLTVAPQFAGTALRRPKVAGEDVLFLGRMTHLKGGDLLVRAVARAGRATDRQLRLVMAGDGPQRAEWQALARAERVDAEFPGWLEGTARDETIARAAVLAVPSVWPEPFGLVGLEAAALGVPAVGFDVGGISQWLHHRRNGLLVARRGGINALADGIVEIVGNPGLRRRFSDGALAVAAEMSLAAHVSTVEGALAAATTRP